MEERTYSLSTPLGAFRAVFTDAGLRSLSLPAFQSKIHRSTAPAAGRSTRLTAGNLKSKIELNGHEGACGRKLSKALAARLAGRRVDLPWELFDLHGRPPFFLRAWKALHAIPFGQVRTYAQIARAAGSPLALRAAGQACGANPIVLFIPCHRVVATGHPGGFGAGLAWKERLLALEGISLFP